MVLQAETAARAHVRLYFFRARTPPSSLSLCASPIGKHKRTSLERGKVLLRALRIRLHRRRARLPARRAHLIRVVLHVLDRLQRAERLVHGAAEGKVVDGHVDLLDEKRITS